MPHRLTEHLRDWSSHGLEIDRDARLIKNVALAGLESKNGYRYADEALRNAVSLYENKPVFLDHAADARRPFERSTRDLVGSIVAPRFAAGRIRGDIRVVDTEAGRTFLALAETSAPAVGMSHVVLAEKNAGGTLVERIVEVVSVDAVAFPATTANFSEQNSESRSPNDAGSTSPPSLGPGLSESLEARLDALLPGHFGRHAGVAASDVRRAGPLSGRLIVEARTAETDAPQLFAVEWRRDADGTIVLDEVYEPFAAAGAGHSATRLPADDIRAERNRLIGERDELAGRLARFERAAQRRRRRREVARLVESARLPNHAITDLFRGQLEAAPDDATRRRLIQERRALVERSARPAPHSRERASPDPAATADTALIAAIRRRK